MAGSARKPIDQVGQGDADLGAGELGGQGAERRSARPAAWRSPSAAAFSTAARSTATSAYSAAPKTPHASTRPTEIAEQQPFHAAHCCRVATRRTVGAVGGWHLGRGTVTSRVDGHVGTGRRRRWCRVMRFSGVGRSHVGLVRTATRTPASSARRCMLVADGVGGSAAGEVASATAAYVVSASALARRRAATRPACCGSGRRRAPATRCATACGATPARTGMATTLTALAHRRPAVRARPRRRLARLPVPRRRAHPADAATTPGCSDCVDEGRMTEAEAMPSTRGATSCCARSTPTTPPSAAT